MIKFIGSSWIVFFISIFCSVLFLTRNLAAQPTINTDGTSNQISTRMRTIIANHVEIIKGLAGSPVMIKSTAEQNKKGASLEVIKKIDEEWIKGKKDDFAMELQTNKVGTFLRNVILENKNIYIEAFLCDHQGAVVGEYPKTTDYWQGDEDKFIKSFNNGNGIVFTGPAEFDESTKTISVQISVPVMDNGKTIGVLIIGLKNIK